MKKFLSSCVLIAAGIALLVMATSGPSGPPKTEQELFAASIKLTGQGSCSGVQVKAPGGSEYVLTAAHCRVLEDEKGYIMATSEDGHHKKLKVLEEDPTSDLLLLEAFPGVHGLDIARSDAAREHVRTYTHGAGFDTYRTDGVLIQDQRVEIPIDVITNDAETAACESVPKHKASVIEWIIPIPVCMLSVDEMATSAMIVPGSSGGMVVDDHGDLVGIVSAGDKDFGYLVRLKDIRHFFQK